MKKILLILTACLFILTGCLPNKTAQQSSAKTETSSSKTQTQSKTFVKEDQNFSIKIKTDYQKDSIKKIKAEILLSYADSLNGSNQATFEEGVKKMINENEAFTELKKIDGIEISADTTKNKEVQIILEADWEKLDFEKLQKSETFSSYSSLYSNRLKDLKNISAKQFFQGLKEIEFEEEK